MLNHRILQKTRLSSLAPLFLSAILVAQVAPVAASDHGHQKAQAKFNQAGELARPANIKEWISIGASVTPKDMNNGKPAFPEFHYVYLDHTSWAHWKKTGEFRGRYHVLLGLLDPLQGVNPEHLKVRELLTRIKPEEISEVVGQDIAYDPEQTSCNSSNQQACSIVAKQG